jgi:hypothetical protein
MGTSAILLHFVGKMEEPFSSVTFEQSSVHKALMAVASEVEFKNRIRFFRYEIDRVIYPPYVSERVNCFRSNNPNDQVLIVYFKYDRAFSIDIDANRHRISVERVRDFCNAFLQGRAKRVRTTQNPTPPLPSSSTTTTTTATIGSGGNITNNETTSATTTSATSSSLSSPHHQMIGVETVDWTSFDQRVLDPDMDVLVLYWNVRCPSDKQRLLDEAVKAFEWLGRLFSDLPDTAPRPRLVEMSSDNNEPLFFPKHASTSSVVINNSTTTSAGTAQPPPLPPPPPPFTIALFPKSTRTTAITRVKPTHASTTTDYWESIFQHAVNTYKTFTSMKPPTAYSVAEFIEANCEWTPPFAVRVKLEQEAKPTPDEAPLPPIFKLF